jgi:hypothetical protein
LVPLVPVFELLVEFGLLAGGNPDVVGRRLWWLVLEPSVVSVVDTFGNVEVETFEVVSGSVVEVGTVFDNEDELVSVAYGVEFEVTPAGFKAKAHSTARFTRR